MAVQVFRIWLSLSLLNYVSNAHTLLRLFSDRERSLNSEYRPLIGIVSHPGDGAHGKISRESHVSYIAASYVKFVEAGGARAVPFIYNEPEEILEQRALEENDKGEYFPVYAVCLGFEILSMIVSQVKFPSDILNKLSSKPLVMQNHKFGISPERMSTDAGLSSFFKLLTTSFDKSNKTYVSTVEAYKYPVTAVQWHPEKNTFEWEIPTIPHSAEAVQVTQSVANFVVSEARKSSHRPTFQQEEEYIIYNYFPAYSGKIGGSFDQVYIFP